MAQLVNAGIQSDVCFIAECFNSLKISVRINSKYGLKQKAFSKTRNAEYAARIEGMRERVT
jgi:hypothetical protein